MNSKIHSQTALVDIISIYIWLYWLSQLLQPLLSLLFPVLAQLMQHTAKAAQRKRANKPAHQNLTMITNFRIKLDEFRTRFQATFRACRSSVYSLAMASLQLVRNYIFKILVMQDTISFIGSSDQCRHLFSALSTTGQVQGRSRQLVGQNMLVTHTALGRREWKFKKAKSQGQCNKEHKSHGYHTGTVTVSIIWGAVCVML